MSRETVRARLEAATEGPWTQEMDYDDTPGCVIRMGVPNEYGGFAGTIYDEGGHDEHDAAFIANARQDIPTLLAVADAAAAMVERWAQDDPFAGTPPTAWLGIRLRETLEALEALP